VALMALVAVLAVPMAGVASSTDDQVSAVVPKFLINDALANPAKTFDVIVQGRGKIKSSDVGQEVRSENGNVKKAFLTLSGVSASVTGKDLLKLARSSKVSAITPDVKVKAAAYEDSLMWADTVDLSMLRDPIDPFTGGPAPTPPTIAIVDSGIDPTKVADFGGRLLANVNLVTPTTTTTTTTSTTSGLTGTTSSTTSTATNTATTDDEGHGTMVAGVAAGSGAYMGGAPTAPIVSLRTADKNGMSVTSDVIAAADWILQNADKYHIKVANFSLAGASVTSFRYDPLDKAVERLWFKGIVVVAAAGNHGSATGPVEMSYAPGNDPFIITVGATDQHLTADPLDDTVAPWSAYGTTVDGFHKPDVSAPGRYMVAAAPMGGTIAKSVPDRIVAPGYMWMSGTSFSTPVVSAAVAQLIARHPTWTPGQIKGALMVTANYLPLVNGPQGGVGEIDATVAASLVDPPNANENLDAFVKADAATGAPAFDQASWASVVASTANWSSANWASASWASASWASASWASANWSSANWSSDVSSMMTSMASFSESTFTP
jgi:serine protease AprX